MPKSAAKLVPVTSRETEHEGLAERWARIAATLNLVGLEDHERAFLATCQKIYRQDAGSTTPFEEFFHGLALAVEVGRMPTPDDVEDDLEQFRMNWNDMKRDAKLFVDAYPMQEAPEAGS